jgi:hypothetical protein
MAGRRLRSSFHLSPAGITAIVFPCCIAASATRRAFLRQPASVGLSPADIDSSEPFGDGSTSLVPGGIDKRDAGDKEYLAFPLGPASSAPTDPTNSIAESSLDGKGNTTASRTVATLTHVEKDITSTMTTTSLIAARLVMPWSPHSHRISNSD